MHSIDFWEACFILLYFGAFTVPPIALFVFIGYLIGMEKK